MPSVDNMLTNLGKRLGETKAQRPSDGTKHLHLMSEIQAFYNEASSTGQPWAINPASQTGSAGTSFLTVLPGIEDYQLSLPSFGKPMQVTTYYPANPSHIEIKIPFYQIDDMDTDWGLPLNIGALLTNYDGSPHTAQRIGFFYNMGLDQVYARVKPIPQLSATYKIAYYLGNVMDTMGLADAPILSMFHPLIELRTCIELLPLCEWFTTEAENRAKREELATSMTDLRQRLEKDFRTWTRGLTMAGGITFRSAMPI